MSNSNLRRMMMAQKPSAPSGGIVTDGLVLWLDGKNRGGIPGHWIDRVNGIDFALHDVTEFEDSVRFSGKTSSYGIADTQMKFPVGTAEAACFREGMAANGAIITASGGQILGVYSNILYFSNKQRSGYPLGSPAEWCNKNLSLSASARFGYRNLEPMKLGGSSYYTAPWNKIRLANAGDSYSFWAGRIYEVRLYNRELTESEILQNQQHDIDTYFGGVAP